jgi:ABC-type lipoprotein release transport system permease subunit
MKLYLYLALKNVFRQKKRSFTLGINYTVVTFILVLLFAFIAGATRNISDNLVRSTAGHITISGQYTVNGRVFHGVIRYPEIADTARQALGPEVTVLPRYIVRSAMYYKGISKQLTFTGIDTALDTGFRDQVRFLRGSWDDFAGGPNGIIVPREVAKYFDLELDDEVVLATRTRMGAFNTGTLKIKGITETDNFFMQNLILCRFAFLQGLDLAGEGSASTLFLYLKSTAHLAEKRAALSAALVAKGFEATKPASDAEAINAIAAASPTYETDSSGRDYVRLTLSTINESLGIVKSLTGVVAAAGMLIALIMLFIIAVSIFINLRMTISERLREIGTMRTIGVEAHGIVSLFIFENTLLSIVFALAGVALALVVTLVLSFIPLPAGGNFALFLNRGRLLLVPRPLDMAVIVAVIAAFSALFSFFPARYGGRIRPVEALTRVF